MSAPRADELFAAALELDAHERHAFVDRMAAGDGALRDEVLSLLEHAARANGFLEPELDVLAAALPARIGSYEILGVLGQGGMGVVYLARQEHPRRLVALKVVRAGLASPRAVQRFAHEAELLGRLRHPSIAQILEAGAAPTVSGPLPFFAMEHVRGRPIDEHCSARALSLRARMTLVAELCDAVQHAHEHGVVHRDLKPSNVLVEEENGSARVKVLDFGVARAIDLDARTRSALTEVGQIVGTLAYMSPEQAAGESGDVDARSDVYALGAIAYELACGRPPLDLRSTSLAEALRRVRDDAPASPSDERTHVPRDLSTVLLKALAKEPAGRYASAADLSADLRRWLADEPVVARRPTTLDRAAKFARRHRVLVVATGAVFAALVAGTIGTATQLARAQHERDRARDALQAADARRRESDAARAAESAARAQAEASAKRAQAVLDFQSEILRSASPGRAGRDVRVVDVLARSTEAAAAALAGEPGIEGVVRWSLGSTYRDLGLYEEAEREFRLALELHSRAYGAEALETVRARLQLGRTLLLREKTGEGGPLVEASAAELERALGSEHPDTLGARIALAGVRAAQGRLAEAEVLQRGALAGRARVLGADHADTLYAQHVLAATLNKAGKIDEAETLQRECLELTRAKLGPEALATLDQENGLAGFLRLRGRKDEAETRYRRVLEARVRVQGPEHPETMTARNNLAGVLQDLGKLDESEALLRAVLDWRLRTLGEEHGDTLTSMNNLGLLLGGREQLAEAAALHERALEIKRRVLPPDDPSTSTSLCNLALVRYLEGDVERALAAYREALEARRRVQGSEHWQTAFTRENVGACLARLQRHAEAEVELVAAFESMRRALGEASPRTRSIAGRLVDVYTALGRAEDAARYRPLADR